MMAAGSNDQRGGIYVHCPFCRRKCPYCSFYSIPYDSALEALYLKSFVQDLRAKKALLEDAPFLPQTIYIGGGTPSILSHATIEQVMQMVLTHFFQDHPPVEVTFECNPESVSTSLFQLLKELGVTRLSIGVQDLTDKGLRALKRPHTVKDALDALEMATHVGYQNISIDLIFGWPGQTMQDLEESLFHIFKIKDMIKHISFYELTIEEGTKFFGWYGASVDHGSSNCAGDGVDEQERLYEFSIYIEEVLEDCGLLQYEISNFSRPGYECLHNIGYWENRPYIGIGPGAVSYLPPRRWKMAHLGSSGDDIEWEESLDHEGRFRETVVIGLRMLKGVLIDSLKERFGLDPFSYYGNILGQLIDDGFLAFDGKSLFLTHRGRMVSNQILSMLV